MVNCIELFQQIQRNSSCKTARVHVQKYVICSMSKLYQLIALVQNHIAKLRGNNLVFTEKIEKRKRFSDDSRTAMPFSALLDHECTGCRL